MQQPTPSATVLQLIFWWPGQIFVRFRKCWDTRMFQQRRFTHTLQTSNYVTYMRHSMEEANDLGCNLRGCNLNIGTCTRRLVLLSSRRGSTAKSTKEQKNQRTEEQEENLR